MAVKKDTPKVTKAEIYTAISKRTSLSKEQIQEVFKAYSDIVFSIGEASNKPIDFAISLPFIGYFQYKRWHNKRTKPTGKLRYHASGNQYTSDGLITGDLDSMKTNPEYDRLIFFVKPTLQKKVKADSIEQIAQAKSSDEKRKINGKENSI